MLRAGEGGGGKERQRSITRQEKIAINNDI